MKQKTKNGKPRGASFADVLAHKRQMRAAVEKAAADKMVEVRSEIAGWIYRGIVVWDKGNCRAIPNRFRNDCEYVVWGTNGPRKTEYKTGVPVFPGCYRVSSVPSSRKHHQTEKPVELLEKLLAICPEGGTVLDPFMGSGSTGVACRRMGLGFVGIERDKWYYGTAKPRMEVLE